MNSVCNRGGLRGGGFEKPLPPGVRIFFFFAIKIRKRNKAYTIHRTATPARVRLGIH